MTPRTIPQNGKNGNVDRRGQHCHQDEPRHACRERTNHAYKPHLHNPNWPQRSGPRYASVRIRNLCVGALLTPWHASPCDTLVLPRPVGDGVGSQRRFTRTRGRPRGASGHDPFGKRVAHGSSSRYVLVLIVPRRTRAGHPGPRHPRHPRAHAPRASPPLRAAAAGAGKPARRLRRQ